MLARHCVCVCINARKRPAWSRLTNSGRDNCLILCTRCIISTKANRIRASRVIAHAHPTLRGCLLLCARVYIVTENSVGYTLFQTYFGWFWFVIGYISGPVPLVELNTWEKIIQRTFGFTNPVKHTESNYKYLHNKLF